MSDIQNTIDRINSDKLSIDELAEYLKDPMLLIRANTIIAIVRNDKVTSDVLKNLSSLVKNYSNEPVLMGTLTCSVLAGAALYWLDTKESVSCYNKLLLELPIELRQKIEELSAEKPVLSLS